MGEMLSNSNEAASGSATTDTQNLQTPFDEVLGFTILQCKSCRSIIGDTSSVQFYNKKTSLLTLEKKSNNILVDEDLVTSKGDFDYGSTFNNLHCKNCSEWLGRTYRTTTPELDHIRGRFSFNLNSLVMYEIAEVELPNQLQNDENRVKSSGVEQIEIIKLQKFVMALYDKLVELESEKASLKLDILSLSNKLENQEGSGNVFIGSSKKPPKVRRIQERNDEPGIQETQIVFDPIKTFAANITTADFNSKPLNEKQLILSAMDDNYALESISWSILNSGKISKLHQEINF